MFIGFRACVGVSTPGIRPNASGAATVGPDGKQD